MILTDNEAYIADCLKICNKKLKSYKSAENAKTDEEKLNSYVNLKKLLAPRDIYKLDTTGISVERAKTCILEGRFFAEHAVAGEATRLGLGTKYLLNLAKDLTLKQVAKLISEEKGVHITEDKVLSDATVAPEKLLALSLGTRHMLAYSYAIHRLAISEKMDPHKVLGVQKMLIILNEATADQIIRQFVEARFFGFKEENVYFMVQRSYHGISSGKKYFYDEKSPKRLHNHGQMVMQQTMENEIFWMDDGEKVFLSSDEFGRILKSMDDKISFSIEDMPFLLEPLDFPTIELALKRMDKGYRMMMEVVANNPQAPQKGGMAAYDTVLKRNVMIESFQLMGIKNSDIQWLNKNFNHYMKPYESWKAIKKKGLNMPFSIKFGHVYFQPVQGDINFLVKTEFFQSKEIKPILHWKSPATTPLMIKHMRMQDEQQGFMAYARKYVTW